MNALFTYVDSSGDGMITREEWNAKTHDKGLKLWLAAMGLTVTEDQADAVFNLIDEDGNGELTAEELVAGLAALSGEARNIDVVTLMRDQRELFKLAKQVINERSPPSPAGSQPLAEANGPPARDGQRA